MTDFGIAKVAEAEALTVTGGMIGTPAYMSPEQCQGTSEITGAADQYSLGIVAYEMITGRPPFQSGTMVNLIYDHCHTPPPHLGDVRPDCPPELAGAIMRMIAKDPDKRFPTIEEAVAAVGTASDTQEVVRTRMLTLAQSPNTAKLLDKFRTPVSPVPRSRTASPVPAGPSGASSAPTPSTPAPPTPVPATADAGASARPARPKAWLWWSAPVVLIALVGTIVLSQGGLEPPADPAAGSSLASPSAPRVARLDVTPPSLALTVGDQSQLSAIPRDSAGAAMPGAVSWEALDAAVSVSPQGLVTARSPGQARLVARSNGSSATVVVTVSPSAPAPAQPRANQVASVLISPPAVELVAGGTSRLTAITRSADGAALSGRPVTWSSSDPRVATVGPDGLVTAVAQGTAHVTASSEGRVGTVPVTVSPVPVAGVTIEPGQATLLVGESRSFSVTARDARGATLADRPVAWQSSSESVASVSRDGRLTAHAPGTATITATVGSVTASAAVTVTARPAEPRPETPADPRPAIEQVIEQYRLAIESRDVERLRAVYPALSGQQESAWRSFFGSVSDLTAELSIASFNLAGDTARARINAVYEFRADRRQTQNTSFLLTLRRGPEGWRIVAVQ
jgi:hypothetical protein